MPLRAFDLTLVLLTLPIWGALIGLCSVAIMASSGRPVFFRQHRTGRIGREFRLWKFRTMIVGDNPLIPEPSRITGIGQVLRRTSLDELPQLINVLRGEMSLVGPRPMLPEQAQMLDADQRSRLNVRPGLTGLAQVNGRNEISWAARIEHDCTWAASPTVRGYTRILAQTYRVVTTGDGVRGHELGDRFVNLATPIDLTEEPPVLNRTAGQ